KLDVVRFFQPSKLRTGHTSQSFQSVLNGMLDQRVVHELILMPVDVAGGSDGWPVDGGIVCLEAVRQTPPCLRNNLQRASHGVDGLAVTRERARIHPDHIDVRRRYLSAAAPGS